jgi:hypothetical protein
MRFEDLRVFDDRASTMRAWSALDPEDKQRYLTLRKSFIGRGPRDDTPSPSRFRYELQDVTAFVNRCPEQREERAIVVGLAISDQFIAVNTGQLKNLIGRCKSSINGCFRSLGYLGVLTKVKSRECVLGILPALGADPGALRQWTVRSTDASSSPSEGGSPVTVTSDCTGTRGESPVEGSPPMWVERQDGSGEENDIFAARSAGRISALKNPLDFAWSEEDTPP